MKRDLPYFTSEPQLSHFLSCFSKNYTKPGWLTEFLQTYTLPLSLKRELSSVFHLPDYTKILWNYICSQ